MATFFVFMSMLVAFVVQGFVHGNRRGPRAPRRGAAGSDRVGGPLEAAGGGEGSDRGDVGGGWWGGGGDAGGGGGDWGGGGDAGGGG